MSLNDLLVQPAMLPLNTSLFGAGDCILVAVSGGVDSLALLHALASRRTDLGVELVAAHVHHGMRGATADADVAYLQEVCERWQVPLAVAYADVPALAVEQRVSVEVAGRDARYTAFAALAAEHGCGKVATAHHADDQVETVLLHLFRGAGIDGLAGMPARRALSAAPGAPELVRPLLRVSRAELEGYCASHELQPRFDSTNADLEFRRNRVRQHLLPLLREYDPAIARHLLRLSDQAQDEQNLFRTEIGALLEQSTVVQLPDHWPIPLPPGPTRLVLRVLPLSTVHPALLRRALRVALRSVAGYALELDALLVDRLIELLSGRGPAAIDLPGCNFEARRDGDLLLLQELIELPVPAPVVIAWPGMTSAPSFSVRISAEVVPVPNELRLPPAQAILDASATRSPLVLRVAGVGERFQPLNGPGRCLLSDFFASRKVPRHYRSVWPVLADAEGPIWILGLATAHRVRVGPETAHALRLQFTPLRTE